ncbi:methyl-accepting chemotaxis protein [Fortiea contorta]|uniref:methyl-accepting chemotaxis protein n=1 Tax=Fortiea contorta TaxID=1892405 RepID=UPI0003489ABD|nr:methyl-accepting chemotaxis protein [Fortiea contorta]
MATSIDDYLEIYKQAYTAYAQQKYEVAATLIDQVVENLPDDPNSHLLRGHTYYVLQKYDVAKAEYEKVLLLSNEPEIIDFANRGLENVKQYQLSDNQIVGDDAEAAAELSFIPAELTDLEDSDSFDLNYSDAEIEEINQIEALSLNSPFDITENSFSSDVKPDDSAAGNDNPFSLQQPNQEQETSSNIWEQKGELELPAFWQEDISLSQLEQSEANDFLNDNNNSPFPEIDLSSSNSWENPTEFLVNDNFSEPIVGNEELEEDSVGRNILLTKKTELQDEVAVTNSSNFVSQDDFPQTASENWAQPIEIDDNFADDTAAFNDDFVSVQKPIVASVTKARKNLGIDDNFDFEAFDSAFGSEEFTNDGDSSSNTSSISKSQSNIEFLDDFDEFDDLGGIPGFDGNIPDFEVTEGRSSFSESMNSGAIETGSHSRGKFTESSSARENSDREDELFSITGSQEAVPVFTQTDVSKLEPNVSVEQGWLAPLENAPLEKKQWLIAGGVGIVSALVVATVSFAATTFSPPQQRESVRNTGWAMSLAAGIAGFATAGWMGSLTLKQIRRTTQDLQAQFDAVRQGNLHVQATVYSEDELGLLATGFNEMARVIFTTTNEAQRKADEQEEAKENLQRQVIRLLDDVEGAARGDLTVQAEVTADVLGAVADAFNLTIQNLRDIVQQVKVAAKEVTKGATNSETFARALSSDALRQAEELGVTLNSVQVMTDSIQRVAEAAREAETVARDASAIALKGGEAVENTVAGILEIRETVAETTRKVKRLAESSQEISKIVALISQIASRTNLLALNASIEAARAGEAGRGFAIVADEVRQLADKSAKSLKEIEQIVMQIQSETGSVMTAMEEGTQQVIKGTKLAEEAKRSLENIIQVANRIDILVRSITSDTVEQTETSRAVAHVMQSVELTAQETSQEAQRVSGALQNLVGVSRDLIASVERFRVETLESR